jgi:ribosomal protein S4
VKKKKNKKEKSLATLYEIHLDRLDGQLISRGVAKNGPVVQGLVIYYCVYVNGELASSPWMSINEGDYIEVFTDKTTKHSWNVGDENTDINDNAIRPVRDSFFARDGKGLESLEYYRDSESEPDLADL